MMPDGPMIVRELMKFGYSYKEGDELVWKHLAAILANEIHKAELDRRRKEEIMKIDPARFSLLTSRDESSAFPVSVIQTPLPNEQLKLITNATCENLNSNQEPNSES